VRFIWDARKSTRNLRERGFDFEFATQVFEARTVERADTRRDYGEPRIVALGIAQASRSPWSIPTGSRAVVRSLEESFRPGRVTAVNAKRTRKPRARRETVRRGRANLARLRRMSEREIQESSPRELAALPADFWDEAVVVEPVGKQPISFRVDVDVLEWFKRQGPKYQSRMNAVLRSYMTQRRSRKAG
jgi:uncharacterized protein (DUF4415 family)